MGNGTAVTDSKFSVGTTWMHIIFLPEEHLCSLQLVIPVNIELYADICVHDAGGPILLSITPRLLLDRGLCRLADARHALDVCSSAPGTASANAEGFLFAGGVAAACQ